MKYGIERMSLMWIASGIVMQIIGYFDPDGIGRPVGIAFVAVGIFAIIMDMRDERKKQLNNTTSL